VEVELFAANRVLRSASPLEATFAYRFGPHPDDEQLRACSAFALDHINS
jgi:hypothetical protein